MRTEDLIRTLATDTTPARPVGEGLAVALLLGALATLAAFFATLGPRPDLEAFAYPIVAAKAILPLLLAVAAAGAALRAVRPGAREGAWRAGLWLAPAMAAGALLIGTVQVPVAYWPATVGNASLWTCLASIPLLALPLLAAGLAALRRGAPVDPRRAGLLAGLVAGGVSTVVYSLFCTADSPLFYVVWYSAGIAIVAGLGRWLGARVLRW
jgi:hypothetical protein